MVDRALQEKQQKIVQAEGEATAAQMLGEAISKNPGYLKLRKLRASGNIAKTVSCSPGSVVQLVFYLLTVSYPVVFLFLEQMSLGLSETRVQI